MVPLLFSSFLLIDDVCISPPCQNISSLGDRLARACLYFLCEKLLACAPFLPLSLPGRVTAWRVGLSLFSFFPRLARHSLVVERDRASLF